MGLTTHSFFKHLNRETMLNIPIDFIIEVAHSIVYYGSAFILALIAFTWHKAQDSNQSK